jgi:crotonobetainyl-CoA hydratase
MTEVTSDTQAPSVVTEQRGRVLIITINRPEARTAVNRDVALGLGHALESAEKDESVWVIVVTGAGDKAFCAGADLKARAQGNQVVDPDSREASWGFAGYARHPISKPTIAAVNGIAFGGGLEIVLASDLVVAADTALFGLPEVKRGIFAGGGGAFRLPRQIPRKIAMEMLLTGQPIDAQRAASLGLVNLVVDASEVLDATLRLADTICEAAPLSVRTSKRLALGIVDGVIIDEEDDWARNASEGVALRQSADSQEGPRAFVEKRAPVWLAR